VGESPERKEITSQKGTFSAHEKLFLGKRGEGILKRKRRRDISTKKEGHSSYSKGSSSGKRKIGGGG